MMAHALTHLSDSFHGFNVDRQARLASTASRTQSLLSGLHHAHGTRAQVKKLPAENRWTTRMSSHWLEDALARVDLVNQEAREEGYPLISELAKRNAKSVLFMAARNSIEPTVYPSMDGEIALYFKSPIVAAALLVLLNNEGGAGCYWSVDGKSHRQRHSDILKMPKNFVANQLRELGGFASLSVR